MSTSTRAETSSVPTVCLLGAGYATGNLGVAALASGAVAGILAVQPHAQIFLLDYAREPATYRVYHPGGEAQVELVNIRFTKKVLLPNSIVRLLATAFVARLIPCPARRRTFLRRNPYLARLDDAMYAASLAGGDSFSDIYGLRRLVYVALPQILAVAIGKKLVQMPQTFGPFRSKIARAIARFLLRRSCRIFTRDTVSLDVLKDLMGSDAGEAPEFTYDVGFLLPARQPAAEDLGLKAARQSGRRLVGLNVSGLLYRGGYTGKNMFGLKSDYRETIQVLLEWLIEKQNFQVLLIPHVFGRGAQAEGDNQAIDDLVLRIGSRFDGHLRCLAGTYDQHEIKHVIGQCDFFLGSRMHACIAAISQAVPTVGLAYSEKFAGVIGPIGCGVEIADLCVLTATQVLDTVRRAVQNMDRTRSQLAERIPSVQADIRRVLAQIPGRCGRA